VLRIAHARSRHIQLFLLLTLWSFCRFTLCPFLSAEFTFGPVLGGLPVTKRFSRLQTVCDELQTGRFVTITLT